MNTSDVTSFLNTVYIAHKANDHVACQECDSEGYYRFLDTLFKDNYQLRKAVKDKLENTTEYPEDFSYFLTKYLDKFDAALEFFNATKHVAEGLISDKYPRAFSDEIYSILSKMKYIDSTNIIRSESELQILLRCFFSSMLSLAGFLSEDVGKVNTLLDGCKAAIRRCGVIQDE